MMHQYIIFFVIFFSSWITFDKHFLWYGSFVTNHVCFLNILLFFHYLCVPIDMCVWVLMLGKPEAACAPGGGAAGGYKAVWLGTGKRTRIFCKSGTHLTPEPLSSSLVVVLLVQFTYFCFHYFIFKSAIWWNSHFSDYGFLYLLKTSMILYPSFLIVFIFFKPWKIQLSLHLFSSPLVLILMPFLFSDFFIQYIDQYFLSLSVLNTF